MEQAWQARAYQRQKLVEELVRAVHEAGAEEENFDLFAFEFLMVLLDAFRERRQGELSGTSQAAIIGMVESFKRKIDGFGRTDAERGLILTQLAEKALDMVVRKENADYGRDEILNTKALLGVDRATDEIELIDAGEDSADIGP